MAWTRDRFNVPPELLGQDGPVLSTEKASSDQLRDYMRQVPKVYDLLRSGATPADFAALRRARDPRDRAVGECHLRLFAESGRDHRIEAELAPDGTLVVTRGRHRVEAARELGLTELPVEVRAPDTAARDAFAATLPEPAQASTPAAPTRDQSRDRTPR